MDYFDIIQNVAKIKLGEEPSAFSDVSSDDYYKIRDAIDSAAEEIFKNNFHDFRKMETTLSVTDGVGSYENVYGIINDILVETSSSAISDVCYTDDYRGLVILNKDSEEGEPRHYTIYGGEIKLYPIPDTTYTLRILHDTDNWAKYVSPIDQSSTASQAKVYVTRTEGFAAGDTVYVEPKTSRAETLTISEVSSTGGYLTMTSNLSYDHTSGNVEHHKKEFEYEHDEPNFPTKHHRAIIYKALAELYYSDPARRNSYAKQFLDKMRQLYRESRGSIDAQPYFRL